MMLCGLTIFFRALPMESTPVLLGLRRIVKPLNSVSVRSRASADVRGLRLPFGYLPTTQHHPPLSNRNANPSAKRVSFSAAAFSDQKVIRLSGAAVPKLVDR